MKKKDDLFIEFLLKWFKTNKRKFSWRILNLTPFQVLIAELLLQKTNANQVEKIFPEFIKKFPDPLKIVKTDESQLAETLRPLGLFLRRSRDLKKTAKLIIDNNNEVPETKKELMNLPGVGEYIANAVLCFAFNKPVPIIDANVGRIMKRVYSFPVKNAPSRDKNLEKFMQDLIPKSNFKEFNLALLDLAALICLPKNPKCLECPVSKICDFFINLNKNNINKNE